MGVPVQESTADAVLVIGDRAMSVPDAPFHAVVDLAEAWNAMTGLPFVFALWVARPGVDLGDLPETLARCRAEGLAHAERAGGRARPEARPGRRDLLRLPDPRPVLRPRRARARRAPAVRADGRRAGAGPGRSGPCLPPSPRSCSASVDGERLTLRRRRHAAPLGRPPLARAAPPTRSAGGSTPSRSGPTTSTATSTTPTSAPRSATSAPSTARSATPRRTSSTAPVLLEKIRETVALGGDQILMQGGLHPDLPLEWYEELLRDIKAHFPQVNIHGFSPPEIHHFTQGAEAAAEDRPRAAQGRRAWAASPAAAARSSSTASARR